MPPEPPRGGDTSRREGRQGRKPSPSRAASSRTAPSAPWAGSSRPCATSRATRRSSSRVAAARRRGRRPRDARLAPRDAAGRALFPRRPCRPPKPTASRCGSRRAATRYGLGARATCNFRHVVSHGGGLPGFGSNMLWLPEHGVALVGLANLTYASWGGAFERRARRLLEKTGALKPRVAQPSPALARARKPGWTAFTTLGRRRVRRARRGQPRPRRAPGHAPRRAREPRRTKHGACRPGATPRPRTRSAGAGRARASAPRSR